MTNDRTGYMNANSTPDLLLTYIFWLYVILSEPLVILILFDEVVGLVLDHN